MSQLSMKISLTEAHSNPANQYENRRFWTKSFFYNNYNITSFCECQSRLDKAISQSSLVYVQIRDIWRYVVKISLGQDPLIEN